MGTWPEGVGRRTLAQTDSTMAEAARRAEGGVPGPEWTLALVQTAARGRRGRAWAMPPGNFAASLLMRPAGGPSGAALRSFVMSLALADTFRAVGVAAADVTLKWPNDVLVKGGKIAGILLESQGDGRGGVSHLVIGVGVNLAAAPAPDEVEPGALAPVSLRTTTGLDITPEGFLDPLAAAFDAHERQFKTYGFEPIRIAWLAQAARLGEVITARLPNEEITGTFRDVDGDGNLVLDAPGGTRRIAAAEIFF